MSLVVTRTVPLDITKNVPPEEQIRKALFRVAGTLERG